MFGALFMAVFLIIPIISSAQTATTSQITGSNESTTDYYERIRTWRRDSSELQQKISNLPASIVSEVPIPILFGVARSNMSPNFGDPRSGGRLHEGQDIMAVKGTPIVSPTPAVVLRTGTGTTEGLYVYTANPGGETFVYMHLDKIGEGVTEGTVLETGSLIGYVGNTGNASGGAAHLHFEIFTGDRNHIDPFPRLTKEFTIAEKISFLSKILTQTSDADALSKLLVINFRSTFNSAISQNITLPTIITSTLNFIPGTTVIPPTTTTPTPTVPTGDLTLGSRGAEVTALQLHLIAKSVGAEAKRLAVAGATGYFGTLTQTALIEYQTAMRIFPADGYYGPATRAVVTASVTIPTPSPMTPTPTSTGASSLNLTRNLSLGMTGEDVRLLQKFLNSKGFVIATTGSGSVGNETTYFGPATRAAVIKFQIAKSISPSVGYVGSITRAVIVGM